MKAGNLSGSLLVGGRSLRMGQDKCLMEIAGVPLWKRQWDLLSSLAEPVSAVAPVRPAWCGEGMNWLCDELPGSGPLSGLAAAVNGSTQARVLVLAVDLPNMSIEYLRKLETFATDDCGVVPEIDGLFQPFSSIYPRTVLATVRAHLQDEDKALQRLLRRLIAEGQMQQRPVSEAERPLFRNWNRPEDCTS